MGDATLQMTTDITVPSQQQGPALIGTGNVGSSMQGYAVAISSDGNTAVVGAYNDNEGVGSLWVFVRQQGAWVQQGDKLQGSDCVLASSLGTSVAISADGNTIAAGGPGDNTLVGATWIFVRTLGVWAQQGSKLVAGGSSTSPPMQGAAVALSRDGNILAVGGNGDDDGAGGTWIYGRSDGVWKQHTSKLMGTGHAGKVGQGSSVALSADGETLIVGTGFEGTENAPVWVFVKGTLGSWVQQGPYLVTSDSVETQPAQRTAVAVSGDGNTFVLGKNCDDNLNGAAWIFRRTADTWAQQGSKLLASDAVNPAEQGVSVAISDAGDVVTVGGNTDNNSVGALWIYAGTTGQWAQQGSKLVGTGGTTNALQGSGVALSADGSTALSGGPCNSGLVGAT